MPFLIGLIATIASSMYAVVANEYDAIVAIALPLNTLLLIVLGLYSKQHTVRLGEIQATSTSAASAAASAAQVAADAARITKELGGILRSGESTITRTPSVTPTLPPQVPPTQ